MEQNNTTTPVIITDAVIEESTQSKNQQSDFQSEQANNLEFGTEIQKMLSTAGTLVLSETQQKALYEPVKDSEVSIKPDGLIYLSWIKYSGRLTAAFTGTGWAMIPQGMPKIQNDLIVWGFHLVIKGVYCGFAMGEQQYFNNGRMTFGEACEGAKSNALMRLCKGLGIGLELWDKPWIDAWVSKYSDKKWDDNKKKYQFSLKPNAFAVVSTNPTITTPPVAKTQNTPSTPAPVKTPPKGKAKIGENTDFLAQKNDNIDAKKKAEVPIVPMTDSELNGDVELTGENLMEQHTALLESSLSNIQLKANYEKVKISFSNGEITEDEKEVLRKLANQLFLKLSAPKK